MENQYKDLFYKIQESAVEYAPDVEYLEEYGELEGFDLMAGLTYDGWRSLGVVASFLSEWFPDCEEADVQDELRDLLSRAKETIEALKKEEAA